PSASGRSLPSAKTLFSKGVPVSGYSSGLFMKSGSIGFALKSTSRDMRLPPLAVHARPCNRPGNGLYTPPLFDLSGLTEAAASLARSGRFRPREFAMYFACRVVAQPHGETTGPAHPRDPRPQTERPRTARDPNLRELDVGPRIGASGCGVRRRVRPGGVLHAMGQSDPP